MKEDFLKYLAEEKADKYAEEVMLEIMHIG
jgi:hypothetical protein